MHFAIYQTRLAVPDFFVAAQTGKHGIIIAKWAHVDGLGTYRQGVCVMTIHKFSEKDIHRFGQYLNEAEYAQGSTEKYLRDVRSFAAWAGKEPITREMPGHWKAHLLSKAYCPETINSMLSALNRFFNFLGWRDFHVKYLRIQRRLFRNEKKELTKEDYNRLLDTARNQGKERLALLMETICATGIRVSELKYITVEAIQSGRAEISLKGKIRTILLHGKLCKKLRKYATKQKITSGEIFLTRSGKGLTRRQIWAEMKALCGKAGVVETKVYPHNLRHLFAQTFYRIYKDVVHLADVLGHASINTTCIYLLTTGKEHVKQLEQLKLIS